ncbi:hypothetical protein CH63R_06563 [Colletotrichum higginsianum IMI 349063]|uniref:Uncharacterized protein n=1 Tax=Colletotrichum higginsianum (strain IMI 349063) TaxID=759273 RepID=A0A1B7YFB8_COLHI|nr:hypothetical protein CH63R_06563 [Colletotrichum higginsianum IMI 349063]OBR10871.1 hypothetical protein CH63R_06563 [Colletotrichum higginsianum IMI 349063]
MSTIEALDVSRILNKMSRFSACTCTNVSAKRHSIYLAGPKHQPDPAFPDQFLGHPDATEEWFAEEPRQSGPSRRIQGDNPAPVFQTEISPSYTGRIILPPETRLADAWRYVVGLRDPSTNRKTLLLRAFAYVGFLLFGYSVGMLFTARTLGKGEPKLVTGIELSLVAFTYAAITVVLTTATDAAGPHSWWAMKWAAAQKADLSVKDIRRILRSDSVLSASKSLLIGSLRAKLAAVFYLSLRLGPPFGFSLLFGGYTVECSEEGARYPWEFIVRTNLGLLLCGGSLTVGVPVVCSIILLLYARKTDSVPRSLLAVAISLSNVIQPLQRRGTMAPSKAVVKRLDSTQRFQAVRCNMNGQFVLEFAPCEPLIQPSPDAAAEGSAVDLTTEHSGSFLVSHAKRLAPPMAGSLLLAIGLQVWLQTVSIRSPDDANICLPMDQIFGYPGARIGLSILVSFYGIAIAAAYEQMMQIYRWSVVHRNPVNFLWLENVFQGHFLLSYWCFKHLPILGGRAFTTGLLGTVVTRLCVGFITPLALLIGWDSATQSTTYRDAVFAMTWVTFGGMVLSSVVVLASTRKDYVPDDDPIVTAVVMQDLVELLRETNGTVRTEKMKIGSVQVHGVEATPTQDSFSRVSVRQEVEAFKAGWYI